jgi:hypothetical protein
MGLRHGQICDPVAEEFPKGRKMKENPKVVKPSERLDRAAVLETSNMKNTTINVFLPNKYIESKEVLSIPNVILPCRTSLVYSRKGIQMRSKKAPKMSESSGVLLLTLHHL